MSLLRCERSRASATAVSNRILYHLSLDRSFSHICADVNRRERFLAVLAALTDDRSDIVYRQEVIRDFSGAPSLLPELIALSARFEELRRSQKNAGKDEYRLIASRTLSLSASRNILQAQALCLKRALLFVKGFDDLLSRYELRSSALQKLQRTCREIDGHADFSSLLTFCSKYENFSTSGFLDFKVTWDGEGRIAGYELIDHRYIHITDPELKKRGFSLFKRATDPVYPCERVYPPKGEFYENLAISALSELSGLFSDLSEQIFARFPSLCEELAFYEVAMAYVAVLAEKQVPYCFPTIADDHTVRATKLYDLYLLMTKASPAEVIPNDVMISGESGGLLVFGGNGSGKTVYLRAIGTMQLLAQAGLPIPCEQATVALCSQIASQFSEAEKEFCEGNDAGRFEQEVRELAAMVDTLHSGALVFLNETFQSTAYAEGAEGLYHLLRYFSEKKIRWILVSHLRQIEQMFGPGEATVLHTVDGYRIVP